MTQEDAEPLDAVAAEYVIGTLDQHERSAFAARLLAEDAARRAVAAWERRLAPLHQVVEAVTPPPYLWERIEKAVSDSAMRPLGVISTEFDAASRSVATLRRSRDRWRTGAAVLGSLAAALLIFVAVHDVAQFARASDPIFVAAVNRGGDKPALIVRVDMRTRQVLVRPVATSVPAGHSLELWYIGAGAAPRSLGLVTDAAARRSIPGDARGDDAATFAVSVEPPGGSPTGGPTGAVLYSGQLVRE